LPNQRKNQNLKPVLLGAVLNVVEKGDILENLACVGYALEKWLIKVKSPELKNHLGKYDRSNCRHVFSNKECSSPV